jgi:hypothetical protein
VVQSGKRFSEKIKKKQPGPSIGYSDSTGLIARNFHLDKTFQLYAFVVACKPMGVRFLDETLTQIAVSQMLSTSLFAADVHHWMYDFLKAVNFQKTKNGINTHAIR